MSRELLKRAATILHDHFDGVAWVEPLLDEIETELAQPEPKPVAWMVENHPANKTFANFTPNFNSHFEKLGCKITPLYAEPVDQSTRIAELEAELAQAYKTVDENWVCHQQLAALQAKREPLSEEEIMKACNAIGSSSLIVKIARAIEAAHGITS